MPYYAGRLLHRNPRRRNLSPFIILPLVSCQPQHRNSSPQLSPHNTSINTTHLLPRNCYHDGSCLGSRCRYLHVHKHARLGHYGCSQLGGRCWQYQCQRKGLQLHWKCSSVCIVSPSLSIPRPFQHLTSSSMSFSSSDTYFKIFVHSSHHHLIHSQFSTLKLHVSSSIMSSPLTIPQPALQQDSEGSQGRNRHF